MARYTDPDTGFGEAFALAVDAGGNVYVTGGSVGSGTSLDYATIKYDGNGNQLWVARYNGPGNGNDEAFALAVDAGGNVYVTGESVGSGTSLDYATIKYDANGNQLWVARYNGPGNDSDAANALAVDAGGNVYVTGESGGSGYAYFDYATIKYDANGNQLWVARYGPALFYGLSGPDKAHALAVDAEGNVYVTGESDSFRTLIGSDPDYATIKYDANGNEVWAARYNGPGNASDVARALAVDAGGNVYVTGGSDPDYATIKYSQAGGSTPSAELPRTGQTTCYDSAGTIISCAGTGQDGDIKAGVAWPSPRFTDNGDGTVTDNLTGLTWTKDGGTPTVGACTGGAKTWQGALDYVACLNTNSYLGHTDWRLPNVNELESLVNAGQSNTAGWLNGQGFTNVQTNYYWSSTSYAYNSDMAWLVDMFASNFFAASKSYDFIYVWPVRAATTPPAQLWKTGQTACYDASGNVIACAGTGQDGDIQAGVSWPSPRFTDNGDGTVTDNLTGLMWLKDANCFGTRTWQGALDTVADFNTTPTNYNCADYDENNPPYTDWRLPNRKELHSLTDFKNSSPALPSGHPFLNVQANIYWSSTSYASYTVNAWIVNMVIGHMLDFYKASTSFVWPVRAGSFTLTLSTAGTGSGAVSGGGTYNYGQTATVSATANPGSTFTGWTGPNAAECTTGSVLMDANKSCTANFTLVANQPDLIISALSTTTTAIAPGKTFSLSNTVKNQGTASAGSSVAAFHLSTDATYGNGDDIVFTTTRTVTSLAAGASSTASTILTIPSMTPLESYYVCAMADSGGTVSESNETNNTFCTVATIQVTRPDLIMTDVTPNAATVNQGAYLSVSDTVLNQGLVSTYIGFRVGYYLHPSVGDDVAITINRVVAALGAGASSTGTTGLLIPSTTPPNNYYVCAKADSLNSVIETDEGNNTLCSSTQVTVPLPDLVMTAVSTKATAAAPGMLFSLSSTVKNQGGSKAGAFTIAFHLSTNTTYGDGDDIAITATRSVTSLGVGASSMGSTTLRVPSTTPLGRYYVCAMADSGNTVAEGDETNNTRCTSGTIQITRADLVMTAVTPNAATVNRGSTLSVTNTVQNQGLIASTAFRIAFRLSVNTTYGDRDDVVITTIRSVTSLAAGASSWATNSLSISLTTPVGSYHVCAMADSLNAVIETDEGNNTFCSGATVTVH